MNLKDALKLSSQVGINGDNLSAGQQQLLSLARAALRRSKLVVLDEPTANVDAETDRVIGKLMRRKGSAAAGGEGATGEGGKRGGEVEIGDFSKSTVVTIAHRIATIADSEVIVVLGGGRLLETGSGETLGKDKGSVFFGMANKNGQQQ